jgi:dTDP-L-rhamnose 4-epimerase
MKRKTILITGGAGFVGSHLADHLLARGHVVRALDDLSPQVHGEGARRPHYLSRDVELQVGDVRDGVAVRRALAGVDAVFHLAARVGVGQSMYEVERYTSVNGVGTATLLEALVERPVERLVVASSMSIYGEGLYRDRGGGLVPGTERPLDQLARREWELAGADGAPLRPVPTPETKAPALPSVYALSKYDQERLCLTIGRAYGIPAVALRFFNVYGPRQALSNPYTGVLAIFAARYLNGRPPLVNEDGLQRRDFVSVHDVARVCVRALESPAAPGNAFNVGSGRSFTILEVAHRLARVLGQERLAPEITGKYRMGDIRHCFADISLARRVLGYEPEVGFEEGLLELGEWLAGQIANDRVDGAAAELERMGLRV